MVVHKKLSPVPPVPSVCQSRPPGCEKQPRTAFFRVFCLSLPHGSFSSGKGLHISGQHLITQEKVSIQSPRLAGASMRVIGGQKTAKNGVFSCFLPLYATGSTFMGKTASLSQVSTLLGNKNHLFLPSIPAVSWNERSSMHFSPL